MPGPYSSLIVLRRRASRSGAGRAVLGRKSGDNADGALIRLLTSNKDSRTRRSAARATVSGACDCQERIRQLVVFTPGSCPRQPAQTLGYDSIDNAIECQSPVVGTAERELKTAKSS